MGPKRRPPKTTEEIEQSVAYDKMSKNEKLDSLILLYSEAEILLFDKKKNDKNIKKI